MTNHLSTTNKKHYATKSTNQVGFKYKFEI